MENMPAVIFALILGTGIGLAIHLGDKIRAGALMMEKASSRIVKSSPSALDRKEFTETLITIIVHFCCQRYRHLWLYCLWHDR